MDPTARTFDFEPLLSRGFSGQLIAPANERYDDLRRVHNGLIDRRPALIARCRGVADVRDGVTFGRQMGLPISVRGGGHNVAGRALDGALVLDLGPMKSVRVLPGTRRAIAEGGVTWGEFNRETQAHALATTGGVVSSTGIAGLTLGGGLGWLMGKYGLAADNLVSADVVTGDGRILTVSSDEHDELFWALRGGGGSCGVVTAFEYQLHEVGPIVIGGFVAYSFTHAGEVLRFHRDTVAAGLADELTMHTGLIHGPDGTKLAVIALCHCGSVEEGAAAAAPIKSFGAPVLDVIQPMPYCDLNRLLDGAYPRGAMNYWKSAFLAEFSDEAIDVVVERFANVPSPMSQLFFEYVHGKVTSVAPEATAFPHRHAGYNMLVLSQWNDAAATERCIAWARDTYDAMAAHRRTGEYVNYQSDEGSHVAAAAFGGNRGRLAAVKRQYDPHNVFTSN